MVLIQYVLILAIVLIIWQTLNKFRAKNIGLRELLFWVIFWIVVSTAILMPKFTVFLANYLGVGRGADLVVYASLIFVFYMIFRIFSRQNRIEKDISKIVEEIAKKGK